MDGQLVIIRTNYVNFSGQTKWQQPVFLIQSSFAVLSFVRAYCSLNYVVPISSKVLINNKHGLCDVLVKSISTLNFEELAEYHY